MRIFFAQLLIRLGQFVQSLALAVLKSDQLAALGRQAYLSPGVAESWSRTVDYGLSPAEQPLLDKLGPERGRLLLLGLGGGREAVVFARAGFEVTGVDFAPALAEQAKAGLLKKGLRMETLAQDVRALEVPPDSFDVVWISRGQIYSGIPTRRARVELLKKLQACLRAGGHVAYVFSFSSARPLAGQRAAAFFRKAVAFATWGNTGVQAGDGLVGGGRLFKHSFRSGEEIRSEFEEGGFEVVHLEAHTPWGSLLGGLGAEGA